MAASSGDAEDALWKANDALAAQITRLEASALTEAEMVALRVILEQDSRTRWLWATARTWALWIAAVGAAVTLGMDALKSLLKRLIA